MLSRLLRAGDVFVDGGANIGLFSLLGASIVGRSGRVLACEPGPRTMKQLSENVSHNDFPSLECHEVALSDESGKADFVVFRHGSGFSSFAPERGDGELVEVAVTTLDRLTSSHGDRVVLVKLDVEGAEIKAIRGARELIARAAPMFLIEVEPAHLARQGGSVGELEDLLKPHGYVAFAMMSMARVSAIDGPWLPPTRRARISCLYRRLARGPTRHAHCLLSSMSLSSERNSSCDDRGQERYAERVSSAIALYRYR